MFIALYEFMHVIFKFISSFSRHLLASVASLDQYIMLFYSDDLSIFFYSYKYYDLCGGTLSIQTEHALLKTLNLQFARNFVLYYK